MTRRQPSPVAYTHSADAVARALGVDVALGLRSAEAARRLAEHGPNQLRTAEARPTWRRILAQFQDPLVYLLIGAIVIALAAWLIEGHEGWPTDALVIAAVLLLNAALGFIQEGKAADAVAALARMTAVTSEVLRDGQRRRIPSAELVPGDMLLLDEGDAVGADARLLSAAGLRIQEASLTGESEAVLKDLAPVAEAAPLANRTSMVFKGTAVVQGSGRAIVTATGMATEMGAIATMLDATREEPTTLQKEVARIGRMLGIAVIVIALVTIATILAVSDIRSIRDVVTVLLLGVSLAVAAVPEGLPAILSLVLALGVQRMAARNAVVKSLSSVETLGAATVICSDKTGTLTRSEMTIPPTR
jgi:P-type Ca2+ transporter type 2C